MAHMHKSLECNASYANVNNMDMKSVKVNDLKLDDRVMLAYEISGAIQRSVNNALCGISFELMPSCSTSINDIICGLSACICSILDRLGGTLTVDS
jgi:hypothetical protein